MKETNGGPAFPGEAKQIMYPLDLPEKWIEQLRVLNPTQDGMSLRDWFAGKAVLSAMVQTEMVAGLPVPPEPRANVARICYEIADAMLKEREK